MAGKTITIDDSDVQDALARIIAAGGDLVPAYKNIGEYEAKITRERFRSKTDPEGQPWQALNELYATTKKGPGILVGQSRSLSRIVWQLAGDGVEIGSNVIYARAHNEGATIRPKTASALVFSMGGSTFRVKSVRIPKRQFLGFSAKDTSNILDIVLDHFVDAAEGKETSP